MTKRVSKSMSSRARWMWMAMTAACWCLATDPAAAKNAAARNAGLATVGDRTVARFDLSWEDSWRNTTNYDACWVFLKYSTDAGTTWRHAKLGGSGKNPEGFSGGGGVKLELVVPPDRLGAFLQRPEPGRGAVSNTNVELAWDAAANGEANGREVQLKVFALEMVYVAACPFFAGMGSAAWWSFYQAPNQSDPYAWGSTVVEPAATALLDANTAAERPNRGNLTFAGCRPSGPYRSGCYADGSANREDAGAGYYGALDLSGNLWAWAVSVGVPEGRAFTGAHGDGALSAAGNANVEFWPGLKDGEVTGANGAGIHGGDFHNGAQASTVSFRQHSVNNSAARSGIYGWRGARTAP